MIVGFRFRKSFKIAPGVKLNVSKKGIGTSVGGKYGRINTSSRGTSIGASIPGTGISYNKNLGKGKKSTRTTIRNTPSSNSTKPTSHINDGGNNQSALKGCLGCLGFILLIVIVLGSCAAILGDEEEKSIETKPVSSPVKEAKEKENENKENKPKKMTLEEQSKKFIDENLNGKTMLDFNNALLKLEDDKLVEMILLGHKDGQQIQDDFDLIGRKATATGKIIDFVELSHNTYNDRGKKSGSVTFTRDDKFYIYMGDKDIESFSYIKYDNLIHKDRNVNEFFLGVYPEEITNFAMIDLDEDASLTIGDNITVEGIIDKYVLRRDYSDQSKIKDFHLSIDFAHVLN